MAQTLPEAIAAGTVVEDSSPANSLYSYFTNGSADYYVTIANLLHSPGAIGDVAPNTGAFTTLTGTTVTASTRFVGALDGIIGGTTPAAGSFTDLTASGVVTLKGSAMSAFIATLIDDANQDAAQTTLGVDPAGTDNSTDVTLAGSYDYLTLSGQAITLGQVDLSTDVTGALPSGNIGSHTHVIADVTDFTDSSSNWNTAYGWGDHSTEGYLTSYTEADPVFVASDVYDVTTADIATWDTAYGWGNHASAGYLTSYTESDPVFAASDVYGVTTADIATWDTAYGWGNHGSVGYLTSYTETDPVFVASDVYGVTTADISTWDTAYGWGDHSTEGYLTSYTETDPVFVASDVYSVTTADISTWDTAYGWGNHASAGYLTSYTETDPVFVASDVYNVTTSDISTWNTAYGWGDHSTEGYLTSYTESDPIFVASDVYSVTTADIGTWNTAYGWGNHASSGYLTSYTESDPIFVASDVYSVTTADIASWDTAYGWGNHASAGYSTTTGTVTSVATSGSVDGLTLTGGTITSSGTITLGGSISITASQISDLQTWAGSSSITTVGTLGSLTVTGASTLANITIDTGSITSASGAISFGDENITTTGTLSAGLTTIAHTTTALTVNSGAGTDIATFTNTSGGSLTIGTTASRISFDAPSGDDWRFREGGVEWLTWDASATAVAMAGLVSISTANDVPLRIESTDAGVAVRLTDNGGSGDITYTGSNNKFSWGSALMSGSGAWSTTGTLSAGATTVTGIDSEGDINTDGDIKTSGTIRLTDAGVLENVSMGYSLLTGVPSTFTPSAHTHAASEVTSGTLAHERGGLEADVSAYDGFVKISGGASSAVTDNSSNWNTAYGWGDHSTAGYSTSTGTVTSVATSGSVDGLTLTGGTITGSGTITLGGSISITESQISDLQPYITGITGEPLSDLSDATITAVASGEILKWSGSAWINNTLAEADIASAATLSSHAGSTANPHSVTATQVGLGNVEDTALSTWSGSSNVTTVGETAVTAHEGALTITESQVSDLGNYVDAGTALVYSIIF